jgi:hypothetical protein
MEKRVKKSFVCRSVNEYRISSGLHDTHQPEAGDVAIFEVLAIGKHSHIQGEHIRNTLILPGDYIMAAFGTRYATAQFEGYIPETVQAEYHILGAGGTVGIVHSTHSRFVKTGPTTLRLIGYAVNEHDEVINTKKICAPGMQRFNATLPSLTKVILSVGASMDSGKTTSAAYLVHGIKQAGYNAAFIKLTGTIYTKDKDLAYDMGADAVADFGDMGFPSTYMCSRTELLNLYTTLLCKVMTAQPDYVVIEIADGIFQRETAMLLEDATFMAGIHGVLFSCGDSLSALQGLRSLAEMGIRPAALSGLFTASPLLMEEVKHKCNHPVLSIEQLAAGELLPLLEQKNNHRQERSGILLVA